MKNKVIGRFNIIRELGKGVQGTVYLAQDTQLDRQVAIKTLHVDSSQDAANLIREAKIASKLQHPNIVSLHDAIVHDGMPYLVYSYIEGQSLAELLKKEKTLAFARAAQIASGVLEGLGHAHQHDVMHLDIKPANIMIAVSDTPMVMDFGIARAISQQQPEPSLEVTGTPLYMAPERISSHGSELRSDLYSVGMMLYEMVTGAPAISGENVFQILHKTAHGKTDAPSSRNIDVDDKLEAIILKAIAKNPDERYPDAASMRQALQQYIDSTQDASAAGSGHSTLEFLLRRMRSKSDFPALSGIISEINKVVSSESESTSKLTQIILKDFALTNKLLKVVNTVTYGQFGGKINTISKAVVIIGFETVRNIAMTLILLDFLQNKAQASELKDEIIFSLFSGVVAAELAPPYPGFAEEAMICSMFHHLGKLLVTFYFFEESQQIARLLEDPQISEEQAAVKVLGLSYNELGIGVAKSWNFPSQMIAAMRKLPDGKIRKPAGGIDQMTVTVNLANELSRIAAITSLPEKALALRRLTERYGAVAQVSERMLSKALDNGLKELAQRAGIIGINTSKSPLLKKIGTWVGHTEPGSKVQKAADAAEQEKALEQEIAADSIVAADETAEQPLPEDMLNAGIQDVTNTLVEDFNLNDVLRMVLETIYRSLGFNRTMIFIRDPKQNQMVARFGFGNNIDDIIPHCRFSLKFEPDVFHLAIDKGTDIVIEDVQAENIANKMPAWHRNAIDAQSLLLLPIMINNKAIGLLYADMQEAHSLQLTQRQLSMLRTLRNQAVLAIKQKI